MKLHQIGTIIEKATEKKLPQQHSTIEKSMGKSVAALIVGILVITNLQGQDLKKYEWKNRLLIIESPEQTNTKYIHQLEELKNLKKDLSDRKIVVIERVANNYKTTDYQSTQSDQEWRETESHNQNHKIEEFKVTLIGLDGGVKLEKTEILKKEDLFGIIDAMPMRKYELRSR